MLLQPQAAVDLDLFRPTPSTIAALWQRYLEIIDPVLKIFHTPTVQLLVFQAIQGRDKLDLASECLLFAIYYATVAAMTPSVCKSELQENRKNLLRRYPWNLSSRRLDNPGVNANAVYAVQIPNRN
jgi:hypothetical protein